MANKSYLAQGIATIDVELLVARAKVGEDIVEMAINTASQVAVTPQTETTEAIKLIKLGRVIAQKPQTTTITGYQLVITDNVFTPDLVRWMQGGTITGSGKTLAYQPPVSGSKDKGKVFEVDAYSAVYDEAGNIINYEVITYPNCSGVPVGFSAQDDTFRTPEYTINSAPKKGQAPFKISYVDELPVFTELPDDGTEGGDTTGGEDEGAESQSYSLATGNEDTDLM